MKSKTIVTGISMASWSTAVVCIIGAGLSWYMSLDKYSFLHNNPKELLVTNFVFDAMCATIIFAVALQRIRLDVSSEKLFYANFSTLQFWRSLTAASVSEIEFYAWDSKPKAMVSHIWIFYNTKAIVRHADLIDSKMLGSKPSAHFLEVLKFIKHHQPEVKLGKNLSAIFIQ